MVDFEHKVGTEIPFVESSGIALTGEDWQNPATQTTNPPRTDLSNLQLCELYKALVRREMKPVGNSCQINTDV